MKNGFNKSKSKTKNIFSFSDPSTSKVKANIVPMDWYLLIKLNLVSSNYIKIPKLLSDKFF